MAHSSSPTDTGARLILRSPQGQVTMGEAGLSLWESGGHTMWGTTVKAEEDHEAAERLHWEATHVQSMFFQEKNK